MQEFPALAGSIPVEHFELLASTNVDALTRLAAGESGPKFIVADRQSAGRGRRGREWISVAGNLHATLLIADPAPASVTPQLCFVAALVLHDAVLDSCAGLAPSRLKLKWPNDLLLDGKKIAGILVEGAAIENEKIGVAVGFGVNCAHHPGDAQFPASDLAGSGFTVEAQTLLAHLGKRWEDRIKEWDRGSGFAVIRDAWLLRASGMGQAIEVRLPQQTLSGIFESINAAGALILRRPDGEITAVSAGDVFPLNE